MQTFFKHRWFILAVLFLIVNTYGVARLTMWSNDTITPAIAGETTQEDDVDRTPLTLKSVSQVDFNASRQASLRLAFSRPPVRDRLRDFIHIKDGQGHTVSYDILGHTEASTVILQTALLRTDNYSLMIKKGLPATDGPVHLEQDVVHKLTFSTELQLRKLQAVSKSFEAGEIQAHFSTPLQLETVSACVSVSPHVDFAVSRLSGWRASGCTLQGAFAPGKSYTVTFAAGLKAENGSELGAEVNRTVYFNDRPPSITFPSAGRYLSTQGSRRIAVSSVNVRKFTVAAERIYPNNLVTLAMRESGKYPRYGGRWSQGHHDGISHLAASKDYSVPHKSNEPSRTYVDMQDLMDGHASGAFLLTARADKAGAVRHLVVVTDTGLSVKRSGSDLLVWANSIHTLKAVTGAVVRVFSAANQEILDGKTDADGRALLHADFTDPEKVPFLVSVERGDDISYLKLDGTQVGFSGDVGGSAYPSAGPEAFVYTDRGIYRPGETSHVVAVVRDRALRPPPAFPVQLRIKRPDGRLDRNLTATLDGRGIAEFDVPWPHHARTGTYRLEAMVPGGESVMGASSVAVEEFVPPRIDAAVEAPTNRVSGELVFDATARHLFGRAAASLPVEAVVQFLPVAFTSAAWPGYCFSDAEREFSVVTQKAGSGRLDEAGRARFQVDVPASWRPASALEASIRVTVTEMSGRAVSAYAKRSVDVFPVYVGIAQQKDGSVVRVGDTFPVTLAAVLPDGRQAQDQKSLRVNVSRIAWSSVLKQRGNGTYGYESERRLEPVEDRDVPLLDGKANYVFSPAVAGTYLLRADEPSSGSAASLQFHAAAVGDHWQTRSMDRPDRVELTLDRQSYSPGDEAKLVIRSPFMGKALVTLESDRLLESRVIDLAANTREITLPVTAEHVPNIYCCVSVIRAVAPGEDMGVHRAVGAIPLNVVVPRERLTVRLDTPALIRPQTRLTAAIRVTDDSGEGAPATLMVAAVDEGICRLTGFRTPDPLSHFRRKRRLGVELYDLYSLLLPEVDPSVLGSPAAPGGDEGAGLKGRLNPIETRRFKPVALWLSDVKTDASGQATVELDVPEFTGELRVMVVAVGESRFGSADTPVTVKRPLVVRTSLPRFLAPSDRCSVPIRVVNETGRDQNVRVDVTCDGPLKVTAGNQSAAVADAATGIFECMLEGSARPGKGSVTVKVSAGDDRYAETFELAVRPASPRITRAGFGSVDPGATANVDLPGGWLDGTAEHALWCSARPTLKLSSALDHLMRYPYGCLEQTTSSAFPLLYLADLATAQRPGSMGQEQTAHYIRAGIYRLLSMQIGDGSFSYWPNAYNTYKWGSVYATHFLVEARRAGHVVQEDQLDMALTYVERLLTSTVSESDEPDTPAWQDDFCRRSYAAYVLAAAGRPPHGWLARLQEQKEHLNVGSRLNLAAALAASGNRRASATILRGIGIDTVEAVPRETGGCLNSGARHLAVFLSTWLDVDPEDACVPLLARRLEAASANGGWYTTQDNALALMALGKYFRVLHGTTRALSAEVSWQEQGGGVTHQIDDKQDWHFKPASSNGPLTIHNSGPGILYYAWSSAGIPAQGTAPELDRRLCARREWFDEDEHPIDIGTLKQGALVIVRVTIDALGQSMRNLVVEDLLPAGLEVENAGLKTAAIVPWLKSRQTLPVRHMDIRDDRVLLFTEDFTGRREFYYAVRAVTPGRFVYPPISAECMYDPSIRSVNGKREIVVEQ